MSHNRIAELLPITIIMPSYLRIYPGSATNRMQKFMRAVSSFLAQDHPKKTLVIAADGCSMTRHLYQRHFNSSPEIKFVWLEKQPPFSGNVRAAAMKLALPHQQIISYLDTDDMYSDTAHLRLMCEQMGYNQYDWCYFDGQEQAKTPIKDIFKASLRKDSIGCFAIAHRNISNIKWDECHGYGHDWQFISKLMADTSLKSGEIHTHGYSIMHIPGKYDV